MNFLPYVLLNLIFSLFVVDTTAHAGESGTKAQVSPGVPSVPNYSNLLPKASDGMISGSTAEGEAARKRVQEGRWINPSGRNAKDLKKSSGKKSAVSFFTSCKDASGRTIKEEDAGYNACLEAASQHMNREASPKGSATDPAPKVESGVTFNLGE